ncbi:hypothetical protein [Isoptericola sp. NPDC057191]|uniref:hypothetical protein n=1 Tax=Isoptericola sp. NPDC057191 TaxID=3346041 RepID=UPI00362C473D
MSTTTFAGTRATRAAASLCAAAAAVCALAGPALADRLSRAEAWALAGAGALLVVVAAALFTRAARGAETAWRGVREERVAQSDALAAATRGLQEAAAQQTRDRAARTDERAAVETAVVALGRKVQASAHRIQEEAARAVQRHSADPDVLQTAMRIDHAAAQHARQAQNLVALCGRRPGQTWDDPLPLPDVVRAAAGRITAFARVEVSGDPGLAVLGRAVEPVVHVVAELLANATQCSPPNTQVLVAVRQVQRGAVIEVDDCGVGMVTRELERVRAIASGAQPVGIADLGEVPQTGLAVVGSYARAFGLRVDLMESVYGGLRAVVMVPGDLTTAAATAPEALAPSVDDVWPERPRETVPAAPAGPASPAAPAVPGPSAPGEPSQAAGAVEQPMSSAAAPPVLPQRRSRRGDAATGAQHAVAPAARPAAPDQTAEEAGAWLGAFFSGSAADDPAPVPTATVHDTTVHDTTVHDTHAHDPLAHDTLPAGVPDGTPEDS